MKSFLFRTIQLLGLIVAGVSAYAVTPIYINNGLVNDSPQIDATAFVNRGTFYVTDLLSPYTTQNTLYYTNRGAMISAQDPGSFFYGSGGFDFEYINGSTGARKWASSIVNEGIGSFSVGYAAIDGPYLIFKATNIVNRGVLSVASAGLIRLEGGNVDLTGGVIEIQSSADTGLPAYSAAINYGEVTNTAGVDPLTLLAAVGPGLFRATSPTYTLEDVNGTIYQRPSLKLFNPLSFVRTNQVDTNRQLIEVVFVEPQADTNVQINVTFGQHVPGPRGLTNFNDVYVQYFTLDTNIITGAPDLQQVVIVDELGAVGSTSFVLGTVEPQTTIVTSAGSGALVQNTHLYPTIFTKYFDTNFPKGLTLTNIITTNYFTAIRLAMSSSGGGVPAVPGSSVTNLPGRVDISAKNLDLTRTRIRGQNVVNIRAENLTTTKSTVVQAPYLYYDLGATTGDVTVTNLAGLSTLRFADGFVDHLSVLFTNLNSADVVSTNTARNGDTNTPENVTNTIVFEADYHVVFLKGQFTAQQPTYLSGITVRGDTATIGDVLTAQDKFQVLSKSLTLATNLTMGNGVNRSWIGTNAPNLLNFTNYGAMTAFSGANFGADRVVPYNSWVNYGSVFSLGITVHSSYLEHKGTLSTAYSSAISLTADDTKIDGGVINSDGDINITSGSLKLRNAALIGNGIATLAISGRVSDGGSETQSRISTKQGISLPTKPSSGDLLGTTIEATAQSQSSYPIVWAAQDKGATASGYTDNSAVGRLYLQVGEGGAITFSGPGGTGPYALYVDKLVLDPGLLASGADALLFDDNFTLYFADANVPVEQVDGLANGHIRWVGEFAGPNSGIKVALQTGQVIFINRNLLNSPNIDSNGNGIVNALDPAPFDVPPVKVTVVSSPRFSSTLSWAAAANAVYSVDYTQTLKPVKWIPLGSVTNTLSVPTTLSFRDTVGSSGATRYYRVSYQP